MGMTMAGIPLGLQVRQVDQPVQLTVAAGRKLAELIAAEADPDAAALRVAVQPGGCSGYRYALYLDDRQLDGDHTYSSSGVPVRIDPASAAKLDGTVIDWSEQLNRSGFLVDNPTAAQSCACGDSFS